jgi:hypothetical protein
MIIETMNETEKTLLEKFRQLVPFRKSIRFLLRRASRRIGVAFGRSLSD